MSLPIHTRLMNRVRGLRRSHIALLAILVAGAAITTPLLANPSGWSWKDQSGLLPHRDGATISLLSANGGSWLASDTSRAYLINGETFTDLTTKIRAQGIETVSTITSDDQQWLISGRGFESASPRAFLTDGNTFTNVSTLFGNGRGGIDASGYRGTWYGRTFTEATPYEPARWSAFQFDATTLQKTPFPLISELHNAAPGCFREVTGVRVCLGETKIVRAGNAWFLIGGNAEVGNEQGKTTQFAKGSVWRIEGARLQRMTNLPAFRFVSGVWQGNNEILLATSDVVSNPFLADRYWVFDGSTMREVSREALAVGLLSVDAREVRAAHAGETWLITIGKKLIRFDGEHMTNEQKTRDFFTTVSSNGQGVYLLGGAVSTPDQSFATHPLTAKLVQVREDMHAPLTNPINWASRLRGPTVTVVAIPRDNVVGDGKVYTIRVTATDADGIADTSVFVNGAKLKTCTKHVCEYTETYYTNGQPTRTVELMGGATDRRGYTNTSKPVVLTIDRASTASASNDTLGGKDAMGQTISVPNNQRWNRDANSGLSWMAWRQPAQTVLNDAEQTTLVFAAQHSQGLGRIHVHVNGDVARSCDFTGQTDIRVCTVTLTGSDYPAGTEIFVNAQILNKYNTEAQSIWTDGIRVLRATNSAIPATPGQTVQVATNPRPIFVTALTIDPDQTSIRRGGRFTVKTQSQNTGASLATVQIYQNNQVIRTCSPAAAIGVVNCDVTIDTSTIPVGTTLSFVAKAIDPNYRSLWSNTRTMTIQDTTVQPQPLNGTSPIRVWNWMSREVSELYNWNTTYSVGAWSAHGIERIEMFVDGNVRRTCAFGVTTGNRECDVLLSTDDYADTHTLSVNARVTDGKGNVSWSDVRSILIRRVWVDDTAGFIPAYASVTTNDETGYNVGERITFTARGWSKQGVNRTQIYLNGAMVANCSGDLCQFTSAPLTTNHVEYQARIIDHVGHSTWTGLIGMRSK